MEANGTYLRVGGRAGVGQAAEERETRGTLGVQAAVVRAASEGEEGVYQRECAAAGVGASGVRVPGGRDEVDEARRRGETASGGAGEGEDEAGAGGASADRGPRAAETQRGEAAARGRADEGERGDAGKGAKGANEGGACLARRVAELRDAVGGARELVRRDHVRHDTLADDDAACEPCGHQTGGDRAVLVLPVAFAEPVAEGPASECAAAVASR